MAGEGAFEQIPDADLMLQVRWGSEPAFAELYHRYYRKLLDFFHGMLVSAHHGRGESPHLAEDLCHETFLRLWRVRGRYAATGSFAAYLFTVARNIWFERCRTMKKDSRLGFAESLEEMPNCPVAANGCPPDRAAERAELDGRIVDALAELPEEQRMAFVLRTVEGLSLDEIAAILQCPVNTVRSRRLLAIKRLREVLRGLLIL